MKRFLVFAGETYYPSGGFQDFISAHDELSQAQETRLKSHSIYGWSHIVDLQSLKIIESQYESNPVEQIEP